MTWQQVRAAWRAIEELGDRLYLRSWWVRFALVVAMLGAFEHFGHHGLVMFYLYAAPVILIVTKIVQKIYEAVHDTEAFAMLAANEEKIITAFALTIAALGVILVATTDSTTGWRFVALLIAAPFVTPFVFAATVLAPIYTIAQLAWWPKVTPAPTLTQTYQHDARQVDDDALRTKGLTDER